MVVYTWPVLHAFSSLSWEGSGDQESGSRCCSNHDVIDVEPPFDASVARRAGLRRLIGDSLDNVSV